MDRTSDADIAVLRDFSFVLWEVFLHRTYYCSCCKDWNTCTFRKLFTITIYFHSLLVGFQNYMLNWMRTMQVCYFVCRKLLHSHSATPTIHPSILIRSKWNYYFAEYNAHSKKKNYQMYWIPKLGGVSNNEWHSITWSMFN